jgi:SAM-dependent methyltransferase
MATLPERRQPTPSESHQAREIAESFGNEAERYERTRPRYPNAMVDAIITASPGSRVLDVGAGTGISARPFQQRGCQVMGVEPDERMAHIARDSGLDIDIARFEDWEPARRTFDVVIAGQAWHWVDPELGASKAADVLAPVGRIALFWNAMSFPHEFAEGFAATYRRVAPEFPFFQGGMPRGVESYTPLTEKAAAGIRQTLHFTEPERWEFGWGRAYTTAQWLDTVPTFGGHSRIPPEKLTELLGGIGHVIDEAGGTFTMGYTALVVTATRADAN